MVRLRARGRRAAAVGAGADRRDRKVKAGKDAKQPAERPGAAIRGTATSGGPDGFGYTWTSSDDASGPTFGFYDISGSGVDAMLDDDSYYFDTLPFTFSFYGTDYTAFAIGSNGTVYFEDEYLGLGNICIPGMNSYVPQRFIAVHWDDLLPTPGGAGQVYFEVLGSSPNRVFVAQWQAVPLFNDPTDSVTVQVALFEGTNNILLQYADVGTAAGTGATVGIQSDPALGLEYSCNAALTNNLAVCFAPPGSSDPTCSAVVPVELQSFDVK